MPNTVTFKADGFYKLSADLGKMPSNAGPYLYTAFTVTSARIKRAWQQKLANTLDVPHGPLTITYDIGTSATGALGVLLRSLGIEGSTEFGSRSNAVAANQIVSQIGSQDGRLQAPIITVLEFGSPVNHLQPHGYGAAALQENADDFQFGIERAIDDALQEVGL